MDIGVIKEIYSFSEIKDKFCNETLLVLDIDDTILKWNKDFTDSSYQEWFDHIHNEIPILTDNNLFEFLKDKDYIFLTARNSELDYITEHHLSLLNIPYNDNIFYTGENNSKGLYLKRITNERYPNKKKIVCVDDLKYNLIEEYKRNDHLNIIAYLFKIKR